MRLQIAYIFIHHISTELCLGISGSPEYRMSATVSKATPAVQTAQAKPLV
jgi:hypothetical protein